MIGSYGLRFYSFIMLEALPKVANSQEPNTYVKVYLKPDPSKETKRKTKVVKKNCHPSFMELVMNLNE